MALKNAFTQFEARTTVEEIAKRLARFGVQEITTEYRDGEPDGLRFGIETRHGRQQFQLPARWRPVQAILKQQYTDAVAGVDRRYTTERHARRVAWRLLRDWVEVQLALAEVGMISVDEAMLPYLVLPETGQTLYEAFSERGVPQIDDRGSDGIILLPPASRR